MDDQYCGFGNLRRLMDDDHFSDHGASAALMHHLMGGDVDSVSGPKPEALPLPPPPSMAGDLLGDNGISGYQQGRWPRQETLTLLEIRSRLDPKFKESAHKAPLWDEVSRIMAEEHGYQRSGKKCREKIENLYKYYKKTKEGKAGRQDGRHYRFFRQLEALYGESSNTGYNLGTEIAVAGDITGNVEKTQFHVRVLNNTNPSTKTSTARATSVGPEAPNQDGCDLYKSLGLSSSDDDELGVSDDSSRDENDNKGNSSPRIKWESKIKDFVDQQVKKFMEVQEAWLEKMLKSLEKNEQERISREEQWRKKETARLHREQEQWANERAWIEARDLALVEVLGKVISTGAGRDQLTTIVRKRNRNDQKKRKGMSTVGSSSLCFDHLEDDGDDDDGIDEEEEEDDRKVGTSRHSGLGTGVVDCDDDDDDDDGCFRFLIERLR